MSGNMAVLSIADHRFAHFRGRADAARIKGAEPPRGICLRSRQSVSGFFCAACARDRVAALSERANSAMAATQDRDQRKRKPPTGARVSQARDEAWLGSGSTRRRRSRGEGSRDSTSNAWRRRRRPPASRKALGIHSEHWTRIRSSTTVDSAGSRSQLRLIKGGGGRCCAKRSSPPPRSGWR